MWHTAWAKAYAGGIRIDREIMCVVHFYIIHTTALTWRAETGRDSSRDSEQVSCYYGLRIRKMWRVRASMYLSSLKNKCAVNPSLSKNFLHALPLPCSISKPEREHQGQRQDQPIATWYPVKRAQQTNTRRTEFPPPSPKASNICCPNNGKAKPSNDLKTEAAEMALAAYANVSTRYNWVGTLSRLSWIHKEKKHKHKVI